MTEPLYQRNPERWVQRRAQALQRQPGLRKQVARAIAWSELGYSSSGIAKRLDTRESTVRNYLDKVAEEHGTAACWAKAAGELGVDKPLGDAQGATV